MDKSQLKTRKAPVPLCFLQSPLLIRGLCLPAAIVPALQRRKQSHKE